jgi:hypothetical protein
MKRTLVKTSLLLALGGSAYANPILPPEQAPVDILIVMDNTHSMDEVQRTFAQNIRKLVSKLGGRDWRIGVITTDSSELRAAETISGPVKVVTSSMYEINRAEAVKALREMTKPGLAGHDVEQGIYMAKQALDGNCVKTEGSWEQVTHTECDDDPTWLRSDSHKEVIIVTDERNCSSRGAQDPNPCEGQEWDVAEYVLNSMPANTVVHGFLFSKEDNEFPERGRNFVCGDFTGGFAIQKPVEYQRLIAATGGVENYICQDAYGDMLAGLSLTIARR